MMMMMMMMMMMFGDGVWLRMPITARRDDTDAHNRDHAEH
jgi:hypothetical protein